MGLGRAAWPLGGGKRGPGDESSCAGMILIFASSLVIASLIRDFVGSGDQRYRIGMFNIPFAHHRGAGSVCGSVSFISRAGSLANPRLGSRRTICPCHKSVDRGMGQIQFSLYFGRGRACPMSGLVRTPHFLGRMLARANHGQHRARIWAGAGFGDYPEVLGLNLMGDGLRDALEPRLRVDP